MAILGSSRKSARTFVVFLLILLTAITLSCPVYADDAGGDSSAQGKIEKTKELMAGGKSAESGGSSSFGADWKSGAATDISAQETGFRMIKGLGICLGVLFIGVYFYKKYALQGNVSVGRTMKILERMPVSTRTSVILAEVKGRRVLLSVGSERVTMLDWDIDSLPHGIEFGEGRGNEKTT